MVPFSLNVLTRFAYEAFLEVGVCSLLSMCIAF